MHSCGHDAVHALERPLEVPREPRHDLRVLGGAARDESPLLDRGQHAGRIRTREPLLAHGHERARNVIAWHQDAEVPLGPGVRLLGRVHPGPIERDDDPVGVPLVDPDHHRNGAAADPERQREEGDDEGDGRAPACLPNARRLGHPDGSSATDAPPQLESPSANGARPC